MLYEHLLRHSDITASCQLAKLLLSGEVYLYTVLLFMLKRLVHSKDGLHQVHHLEQAAILGYKQRQPHGALQLTRNHSIH